MTERTSPSADTDPALADAVDAFAHWRATRRRGREPTPAALRALAVALLDTHRPSHLVRALAIGAAALSRWAAEERRAATATLAPEQSVAEEDAFVTLPSSSDCANAAPATPVSADTEPVIRWPHGAQLVARGPIPSHTLRTILEAAMIAPSSRP